MLIKMIVFKLFIEMRLYLLVKYVAPIAMFGSLYSLILLADRGEDFQYQQPQLRKNTQTLEINQINKTKTTNTYYWHQNSQTIYDGVTINIVQGMISYETLLLTAPCSDQTSMKIFDTLYLIYQKRKTHLQYMHIPKNIAFICYSNQTSLGSFMEIFKSAHKLNLYSLQYQPRQIKMVTRLGIIRNTLNIDFSQSNGKGNETRIMLDIYDNVNGLNADTDFYQYIKENIQGFQLRYYPCEEMFRYKEVYRWIKKNTVVYRWTKWIFDFGYCQFNRMLFSHQTPNINSIFISSGIQTITLKIFKGKDQASNIKTAQKIGQTAYAYFIMFSLFEDHLHSSNSMFYPLNDQQYVQVGGYFIPGTIFLTFSSTYILIKLGELYLGYKVDNKRKEQMFFDFGLPPQIIGIIISLWVGSYEYYYWSSLYHTLWGTFIMRLMICLFSGSMASFKIQQQLVRYSLITLNTLYIVQLMLTNLPLTLTDILMTLPIWFLSPKQTLTIISTVLSLIFCTSSSNIQILKLSNPISCLIMSLLMWATTF